MQTLTAFAIAGWGCLPERVAGLYAMILKAVAMHRVGDRPDRIEPRANKVGPEHSDTSPSRGPSPENVCSKRVSAYGRAIQV